MKIGDECWVTVNSDEYITSGMLNCSLASAEMLRDPDDGLVRVRIVPAEELERLIEFKEVVLKHVDALRNTSLKSLATLLKEVGHEDR